MVVFVQERNCLDSSGWGDITLLAGCDLRLAREHPIAAAEPAAGADKLAPNDDHQTAPPRG
jgi:hypothetical protein